jgi:hypothetical protein
MTKATIAVSFMAFATLSSAQFGGPSRYDLLRKEAEEKQTGVIFASIYPFGSSQLTTGINGFNQSFSQPSFAGNVEAVLNPNGVHPLMLGITFQQDRANNQLEGTNFTDIYVRGYFSTIWGAQIGRKSGGESNATQYALFADLLPNGDRTQWRAQAGFGGLSGSGTNASQAFVRVSYRLKDDWFIDWTSNSFMQRSTNGFQSWDDTLAHSYLGIMKRF